MNIIIKCFRGSLDMTVYQNNIEKMDQLAEMF